MVRNGGINRLDPKPEPTQLPRGKAQTDLNAHQSRQHPPTRTPDAGKHHGGADLTQQTSLLKANPGPPPPQQPARDTPDSSDPCR